MQSSSKCDFTKCCYFINLKTGCLLIGYFYLIELFVAFILVVIRDAGKIAMIQANEKLHHALPLTIGITCLVCFFFVMAFTFSIILLVGIYKNKPEYVKTYLIFKIIFLVIYVNLFIYTVFSGRASPFIILFRIVQIAVSIYFLLVIRSYHMHVMKRPSQQIV